MSYPHLPLEQAITALRAVLPLDAPADAVLSRYFRENPMLGNKDRAFIAELVFGVLRRKRSLETATGKGTPRQLALAWLVRVQGMNMRQLEPHLRGPELDMVPQIKALDLATQPLAVQWDMPDWLAERLLAVYGEAAATRLAQALLRPAPLDLRVNTLLAKRDEMIDVLNAAGITATATPYSPMGIRLADKPVLAKYKPFLEGKFEIQDEGSQLLGYLVAPRRGEMVVDFCAGAGGKTLLLGALMHSSGRLYAFDVSEKRLAKLKPRLKRSGLSNLTPQLITSENDTRIKRLAGKIDRVLVDAPCSGMGTLRRNPDLKWRQSPDSVAELSAKQAAILAAASRLVKSGGRLVYATCSLLPEENEQVVEAFIAANPRFVLKSAAEILQQQHIALDTGDYLRLNPAEHGTDGFFAAVLEAS
ncbi:RsmB/NOP family class I SAM-dependent RNA methyltransferase [Sulfuriferula sp. GW1]|uniref:RsmB/NOP family class I SAM-dependent RNA methyltransferase n=1 Tax=Sulfuriferula sp. GW1 TaxID=3345111 RepID=UPI0039B027A4